MTFEQYFLKILKHLNNYFMPRVLEVCSTMVKWSGSVAKVKNVSIWFWYSVYHNAIMD